MPLFEIERKFLVTGDFRPYATGSTRIAQGYIASGGGRTVRVRIRGEKGCLTIKGPSNKAGLGRFEWEKEIPLDDLSLEAGKETITFEKSGVALVRLRVEF